ncbi:GNAT family N-acetyltransferase [Parabacteroides faecis]|uniref:GNAT family N-acetyltransferase n=1 Tax=Parabacteroides faecis TaxID=1217282 RepID=UPI002164C23A|nr:GNAT family N-acetyltransferase [Parabacteroides faecis]MCS2893661.1 GNAT family N-acetyltransferase [Parabacteroides faecis]UVQ47748.1 GNAT family N-acetyltransferase [Parabacteroides faecis]
MALLENEMIRLRALEPEDLELLYRWENNPDLWELGNTMSPYSRYILKEYIRESHRDIFDTRQLRLMIELRSTGAAIGTVDLYDFEPHHRRAGIGILVDPLYQGERICIRSDACIDGICFSVSEIAPVICSYPDRE